MGNTNTSPQLPPGCVDIAILREVYADNRAAQAVLNRIEAGFAQFPMSCAQNAQAEFRCNNGRLVRFNVCPTPSRKMPLAAQAGAPGSAAAFPKVCGVPDLAAPGNITS